MSKLDSISSVIAEEWVRRIILFGILKFASEMGVVSK